jgi:ElaB/YqjD/DUF883 family membrane-anchored ribosome-binding protein
MSHDVVQDADVKSLQSEVNDLRDDIAKIGDTLQDMLQHGGAALQQGGAEAFERVQDQAERLRRDLQRRAQSVAGEIEERPLTAALIAFGVGMVLGMLFHGRR